MFWVSEYLGNLRYIFPNLHLHNPISITPTLNFTYKTIQTAEMKDKQAWIANIFINFLLVVHNFLNSPLSRETDMSCLKTKLTKWHVCPAKTQISLGIWPV